MKEESGRLVYINRTFEETFGLSLQSAVGQRDADWLPPEAAEESRLHDETVFAQDQPLEFEETLPTVYSRRSRAQGPRSPRRDIVGSQ